MSSAPYRIGNARYEIQNLIGKGGMAEVHRAYDTLLSRTVAIKMLRTDLAKDSIFLARFRREAQSSASLNHPNIVGVYDTGEQSITVPDGSTVSIPYIVMEYVEGHTVHELLTDGQPVPINEAVEITTGILKALAYSHKRGLVHRDIKPGNVMLTNDGKIKVMDFGIARALEDSGATMTKTDAVLGTAQYLSPEQARGQQVDERSDLYSCGCMLFELLTGRPPFRGDSAVSVAYQHVAEQPPIPSSITSDISPAMDQVVLKSLAKLPQDRYQTAEAMIADMNAALHGATPTATAPTSVIQPQATQALPAFKPTPVSYPDAGRTASQQAQQIAVEESSKKSRKGKIAAVIALLLLLALMLLGGWLYLSSKNNDNTESVVIPSTLIGKDYDVAANSLTKLGLKVTKGEDVPSDTIPEGKVAQTDPGADSKVAKGSEVTIHLSSGPNTVKVPDISGLGQDEAREILKSKGLSLGSVTVEDDPKVTKDKVIKTNPAAGSSVNKGDQIGLVISSGYVAIDEAKIKGKPKNEVLKYLQDLGLSTDTTSEPSAETAPGNVISISPSGRVAQGSSITVKVAEPADPPNDNTNPNDKEKKKNNGNGNGN